MEFTFHFLHIFVGDLAHASPILGCLLLSIVLIGYTIGRIEGWPLSDAMYHAFINATTIGYGDLYPTTKRTKLLAVTLGFVGLLFGGMIVAITLDAGDQAYAVVNTPGLRER